MSERLNLSRDQHVYIWILRSFTSGSRVVNEFVCIRSLLHVLDYRAATPLLDTNFIRIRYEHLAA